MDLHETPIVCYTIGKNRIDDEVMVMEDHALVIHSAMGGERKDYEAVYTYSPSVRMYEMHNHRFYEFYLHLGGEPNLFVNNRMYHLTRGSLMIFPPFVMHGFSVSQELHDYERAFIYLSPELMNTLGCNVMSFEQILLQQTSRGFYMFHMQPDALAQTVSLIQRVRARQDSSLPMDCMANYADIIQILLLVCQTVSQKENIGESFTVNTQVIEVMGYINDHFTEPLSLGEIAERINMSKSSLSHLFSQHTGTSVYSYIQFRRITYAKELLMQGVAPQEAAYQCGFNDYSSFQRAFRNLTGCSPRAYLRDLPAKRS